MRVTEHRKEMERVMACFSMGWMDGGQESGCDSNAAKRLSVVEVHKLKKDAMTSGPTSHHSNVLLESHRLAAECRCVECFNMVETGLSAIQRGASDKSCILFRQKTKG
jgi:hypothetical protein